MWPFLTSSIVSGLLDQVLAVTYDRIAGFLIDLGANQAVVLDISKAFDRGFGMLVLFANLNKSYEILGQLLDFILSFFSGQLVCWTMLSVILPSMLMILL